MRWGRIGILVGFLTTIALLFYLVAANRNLQYRVNLLYASHLAEKFHSASAACLDKAHALGWEKSIFTGPRRQFNFVVDFDSADNDSTLKRWMKFTNSPSLYAAHIDLILDVSRGDVNLVCFYNIAKVSVSFESTTLERLPSALQKEILLSRRARAISTQSIQ